MKHWDTPTRTKPRTQLKAWNDLRQTVTHKRAAVLDVIKKQKNGATLFELCDALNWPVNRVSGRVTELKQRQLIKDSGTTRINPLSGKRGIVWVSFNERK